MESLIRVAPGDDDVVVAISGFGSANVGGERWRELASLTGRTVFHLKYDAQELPWKEESGPIWPIALYHEMKIRWEEARSGARIAAKYLAPWLTRWASSGRRILIVGFSLGAYVALEALKLVSDDLKGNIDFIMMSGALVDSHENWGGSEHLHHIVNLFSYEDMVLRYLYPMAVDDDETPAAGLGPLVISDSSNVDNVDFTDLIGRNHLWGSRNIDRLFRAALTCLWSSCCSGSVCSPSSGSFDVAISEDSSQRLYRWTVVDPEFWSLLALGLDGDAEAVSRLQKLDSWSLQDFRLSALLDAGSSSVILIGTSDAGRHTALRGLNTLSGLIHYWVDRSGVLV